MYLRFLFTYCYPNQSAGSLFRNENQRKRKKAQKRIATIYSTFQRADHNGHIF